ncbi:hypothetical protein EH152_17805 [Elizabethkingia anophelis]|nr:hypothetical protein [Elizabethkingia anophelis]
MDTSLLHRQSLLLQIKQVLDGQNRRLEAVYCIVWMDGVVFKVRQGGKVINKTIYLAVGLNLERNKEILEM